MSDEDDQTRQLPGGENEKLTTLEKIIDWFIESDPGDIERYISKLRSQNGGISNDDLAQKIVRRKSHKNGLVGAATGIPGFLALPVTVPADLIASWKIQIHMALCVAYVYGHTHRTTDLKTDVYLILAGDAAKEALKRAGIQIGKEMTKRVVQQHITRDVMVKIWKVVGQKVITKAGQKSMTSFVKLVPLIGAPIGYGFDWTAARFVGRNAISYYSGRA